MGKNKTLFNLDLDISLFDEISQPTMIFDKQGDLIYSNQTAEIFLDTNSALFKDNLKEAIVNSVKANKISKETIKLPFSGVSLVYELTIIPINNQENSIVTARDATLEDNLKNALVESRERYKDFVEISSDFAWETDKNETFVFVSPTGALGYQAKELNQKNAQEISAKEKNKSQESPFNTKRKIFATEYWLLGKNGEEFCYEISAKPILNEDGEITGSRGVCKDITALKELDLIIDQARQNEKLISTISRDIIDEIKPENMLKKAVKAITKTMKISGCEIFRKTEHSNPTHNVNYGKTPPSDVVKKVLYANKEKGVIERYIRGWSVISSITTYKRENNGIICLWKEGHYDWTSDEKSILANISTQMGIAVAQINQHEYILALSRTDPLTQLFNRRAFFEEAKKRYERLKRDENTSSLFYIDLDNFKLVNDVFGHQKGDEALLKLVEILSKNVRPTDIVGRLGGDEFAIWFDDINEKTVRTRAEKILKDCEALKKLSGKKDKPLQISIGITIFKYNNKYDIDSLINKTDEVMYSAKKTGKGRFELLEIE